MNTDLFEDIIDKDTKLLFESAYNTFNDKMQKYSKSVENSLKLTDMNIQEKSMVAPSIHHGFVNCLFSERNRLKKLEEKIEEFKTKYVEKHGSTNKPVYILKKEVDELQAVKKLEDGLDSQKIIVKYLEECCKILSNFNFNIKNSVELMKLER